MQIKYRNTFFDLYFGLTRHLIKSYYLWILFLGTFLWRYLPFLKTLIMIPNNSQWYKYLFLLMVIIQHSILFLLIILIAPALTTLANYFGRGNSNVEHIFVFDDDKFVEETTTGKTEYRWSAIYKLSHNWVYIYIFLDRSRFYIIPKRIFKNKDEVKSFFDFLNNKVQIAKNSEEIINSGK